MIPGRYCHTLFGQILTITGLFALLLAASSVLASDTEITHLKQASLYDVNALGGPIPTYVYGAPAPGANSSDWIAPLRLPGRFKGASLAAANPAEQRASGTRLVLLFNSGYQEPGRLCRDPSRSDGSTGYRGHRGYMVYAVMCIGHTYATRGLMRAGPVTSPNDPAYARHMARLFDALFPPRGPSHSRS